MVRRHRCYATSASVSPRSLVVLQVHIESFAIGRVIELLVYVRVAGGPYSLILSLARVRVTEGRVNRHATTRYVGLKEMSSVVRKLVYQVSHKPGCTTTEDG